MKDQSVGLVVDVSMTVAALLDDEDVPVAKRVLAFLGDGFALVPSLWHVELANAIAGAVRRGRMDAVAADPMLARVASLDIRTDVLLPNSRRLLAESQQFGLTAYDTSYLLLARDRGLPLATLDEQLAAAATRAGVPLVA